MKSRNIIFILVFSEVVHCSRWSVNMPWFVSAVNGSCAEIPCTFDYPAYGHSPWGMWLKGGSDPSSQGVFIVYDPRASNKINVNYLGRTELNGNFAKKQCSLRIKDIRNSDEGEYYFRLKISTARNVTEQYTSRSQANISILEKPSISLSGELIAGQRAQLTCSITHSCPSANLELKWTSDQGYFPYLTETKTSEQNVNGFDDSRRVSSIFTFVPSSDHHGKTLGCKLIVEGVEATVQETLTLAVKSPMTSPIPVAPRKPIVNSSIVALEGSSVLLYCTAQDKLPVSLRWVRDGSEIKMSSTGELRQIFHNISSKDDGQYWCVAENIVGKANSSTQISVQYKPSIVSGPNCTISESGIDCTCSVRANPPGNITWGLNGRNITRNSSDGEVISWAVTGHLVQSSLILIHPTRTGNQISCVAANEHGVSVGKYQLQLAGTFPWKIVIPVAAATTLIILFLIAVMALRKKTRDTVSVPATNNDSVTYAAVQHPFNNESQGQYANTDVRGAASKQSAERENVLYAAVNVSNVRKHEKYLQNEESSE